VYRIGLPFCIKSERYHFRPSNGQRYKNSNLGYQTFLNGTLVSMITIDTSQVATDPIDYVATDPAGLTATSTRTVLVEAAIDAALASPAASSTEASSTAQ
jgi:hypothetical protein